METTKDNILEEATWSPLNARFSLFAPGINKATGQRPYLKEANLYDVYRWMNSMKMKEITEQLRGVKDEKRQKAFKAEHLPFATFSGTFEYRNTKGLIRHSQMVCLDFDHLGGKENIWKVRETLENDPTFETLLMFTSPRGDGVKWVTHIDLSRGSHEMWYRAICNYLYQKYGLEADKAPANVASACFLCWDANLVINKMFNLF